MEWNKVKDTMFYSSLGLKWYIAIFHFSNIACYLVDVLIVLDRVLVASISKNFKSEVTIFYVSLIDLVLLILIITLINASFSL